MAVSRNAVEGDHTGTKSLKRKALAAAHLRERKQESLKSHISVVIIVFMP